MKNNLEDIICSSTSKEGKREDNMEMEKLMRIIPEAKEIRRETDEKTKQKEMKDAITDINLCIQNAKKEGATKIYFHLGAKYAVEIKKMYEEKGYRFTPIEYGGGDAQQTEYLCW